jgi:hydrogenase maturation protease
MRPDTVLVIGYGNDLRGDDAAGPRAACEVAAWHLPHVRVVTQHQLTPELADPLAAVGRAVFLDAHVPADGCTPCVRPIAPALARDGGGHTADPAELLALARTAYGRAPDAWLLTIPAEAFQFGAPLSRVAERGVADALALLRPLLNVSNVRPPVATGPGSVPDHAGDERTVN